MILIISFTLLILLLKILKLLFILFLPLILNWLIFLKIYLIKLVLVYILILFILLFLSKRERIDILQTLRQMEVYKESEEKIISINKVNITRKRLNELEHI